MEQSDFTDAELALMDQALDDEADFQFWLAQRGKSQVSPNDNQRSVQRDCDPARTPGGKFSGQNKCAAGGGGTISALNPAVFESDDPSQFPGFSDKEPTNPSAAGEYAEDGIRINKQYWKNKTPEQRKSLVAHELGHAVSRVAFSEKYNAETLAVLEPFRQDRDKRPKPSAASSWDNPHNVSMGYKTGPEEVIADAYAEAATVDNQWEPGGKYDALRKHVNKMAAIAGVPNNDGKLRIFRSISRDCDPARTPGGKFSGQNKCAAGGGGDKSKPDGAPQPRVLFEVAPDPNNKELTENWNSFSDKSKIEMSQKVQQQIVPEILASIGVENAQVMEQLGGYLDEVNPSFAVVFDDDVTAEQFIEAMHASGFALSQDSMMGVSMEPMPGAEKAGIVSWDVGRMSEKELRSMYLGIREETGIEGITIADGEAMVVDFSGDSEALAEKIDKYFVKRNSGWGALSDSPDEIRVAEGYVSFPQKQDYDYGSGKGQGAEDVATREKAIGFRQKAQQAINEAIAETETKVGRRQYRELSRKLVEGSQAQLPNNDRVTVEVEKTGRFKMDPDVLSKKLDAIDSMELPDTVSRFRFQEGSGNDLIAGRAAYYRPDTGEITFNEKVRKSMPSPEGWNSSTDKLHDVYHETAHAFHDQKVRDKYGFNLHSWITSGTKNTNLKTKPSPQLTAQQVSGYAQTQPVEFVAEVFAAHATGRRFSQEVYDLYDVMDGPDLIEP